MSLLVQAELFYLGLVVSIFLILLFRISAKKRKARLRLLTSEKLFSKLIPENSPTQQITKSVLLLSAVLLLFFALARPQWGSKQRTAQPQGIDVLIAVDVSKSMLARDVTPNRLQRVKLGISNLLQEVAGDRLGLIAFAGSSFLQCPLTLDHQAFLKTLNELEIGIIKEPGTNLAHPIDEAARSFSDDDSDRFLILLSDGEDLEGQGLKRAKIAANERIRIYTIGIGSKAGAKIPINPTEKISEDFLLDRDGNAVITKMDEKSLQAIAELTGGKYFSFGSTGQGLSRTLQHLQDVGLKRKKERISMKLPIERFQPFVLLAIFLLMIDSLTSSGRKKLKRVGVACIPLVVLLLVSCLQRDNIKRAEESMDAGDYQKAAFFYKTEINATREMGEPVDPKLMLNAGLALLKAESLEEAEKYLGLALDFSLNQPELQSIVLNALGNLHYQKTNFWLDRQNVSEARISWEKALSNYGSAFDLDGNDKALANLTSLKEQIEKRINSLVSKISGRIWRDLNGDGEAQENEPALKGFVYWDRDGNGEHNSSNEPKVPTNHHGHFSFEWITGSYPTSILIGSTVADENASDDLFLVPVFPPPPPPLNPEQVKNHYLKIEKPKDTSLPIAYRNAPTLLGKVWSDLNGDGVPSEDEKGFSSVTIYLDQDGNFQLDQNETFFKPKDDGSFAQPVPPGQYSVCIKPDNPDANVTYPRDEKKAYLSWVNFEASAKDLDFGIQDNSNQQSKNHSPEQSDDSQDNSDPKPSPSEGEKDGSNSQQESPPQEVNALYERLLQEMDSKSVPLGHESKLVMPKASGRNY